MVSYKDEHYAYFGWTAAPPGRPGRLDPRPTHDPGNGPGLPPGGAVGRGVLARGPGRLHPAQEPHNSGWPEAAAAGALGVCLWGPSLYAGRLVEKPCLNPQAQQPEPADLEAALNLLAAAAVATALALFTTWVLRGC
jgi:adenosylcobinamide-phosphate synthase